MFGQQLLLVLANVRQGFEDGVAVTIRKLCASREYSPAHALAHLDNLCLGTSREIAVAAGPFGAGHVLDGLLCLIQLEEQLSLGLGGADLQQTPGGNDVVLDVGPIHQTA